MSTENFDNRKILLMDTCFFIEFLNNDNTHYYITEIKKLVNDKYLFVITPYSLYEYLINVEDKNILNVANKICFNTDFFVLNVNHIFNDYEGYLDGRSFVFKFGMNTNNSFEFNNAMKGFKQKVYETLLPKIYLIAQVIAIFWILFNESTNDGKYNQDTRFKIHFIDEYFLIRHKKRYDLLFKLGFEYKDFKYHVADNILELVLEMLALANVETDLWKNSIKAETNDYNKRVIEEINRLQPVFNRVTLHNLYKKYYKRTGKRYSLDYLVEWALSNMKLNLMKDSFKMLIKKAFSQEGFHKKETNNDIIDFTNMCLIEDFDNIPVAYLTSEKKWLKYINGSDDDSLVFSKTIIKKYINNDYWQRINK